MEVTDLTITQNGDQVIVDYAVTNTGNTTGTTVVTLTADVGVDGDIDVSRGIDHTVQAGETETNTLVFDVSLIGTVDVKVCAEAS